MRDGDVIVALANANFSAAHECRAAKVISSSQVIALFYRMPAIVQLGAPDRSQTAACCTRHHLSLPSPPLHLLLLRPLEHSFPAQVSLLISTEVYEDGKVITGKQ